MLAIPDLMSKHPVLPRKTAQTRTQKLLHVKLPVLLRWCRHTPGTGLGMNSTFLVSTTPLPRGVPRAPGPRSRHGICASRAPTEAPTGLPAPAAPRAPMCPLLLPARPRSRQTGGNRATRPARRPVPGTPGASHTWLAFMKAKPATGLCPSPAAPLRWPAGRPRRSAMP
jgi:hypothetical protein